MHILPTNPLLMDILVFNSETFVLPVATPPLSSSACLIDMYGLC